MTLALAQADRKTLAAPTHRHLAPVPVAQRRKDDPPDSHEELVSVPGPLAQARNLAVLHPDSPAVLARLARCELDYGDQDRAGRAAEAALTMNERVDLAAIVVASQILAEIGRPEEAEETLGTVLASGSSAPNNLEAVSVLYAQIAAARGEPEMALARLDGFTNDSPLVASLRGSLLIQLHRYQEAIAALRGALRSSASSADVLLNLGYAHGAIGSLRKAIRNTLAASSLVRSDRTAGLNLVAFLLTCSEYDEALDVVERLAEFHPDDLRLELAAADVLSQAGDPQRAIRRLKNIQAERRYFGASPVQRSELKLNIKILEYQTGLIPVDSVLDTAIIELEKIGYRSEIMARHLPFLAPHQRHLQQLESALEQFRKVQPQSVLVGLEAQISYFHERFDETFTWIDQWLASDPFSTAAYVMKTYLLSVYKGEYEAAVSTGMVGLRLEPGDWMLRNNVAFSLAMCGRTAEASWYLPDPEVHKFALPTAALIEVVGGDIQKGLAMYDESEVSAQKNTDDPELPGLIRLYRTLAQVRAGAVRDAEPEEDSVEPEHGFNPRFKIVRLAIEREQRRLVETA